MKKLLCGCLLLVFVLAHSALADAASVVLGQAGAGGVSATISPDPGEIGRPATIWMGAVLNGTLYLRNGPTNWAEYRGGSYPIALTSSALPSSLQVSIVNFDISSLPGLDVYVGYGSTEADLSRSGHLAKVYTVPTASPVGTGSIYEALPNASSSANFITQANAEGARGYWYKADECFDSACSDRKSIYVKDNSQASTYSYEALPNANSSANFITQANTEGARGYWYKAGECFDSACSDRKSIYVKGRIGLHHNWLEVGDIE